MAEDTKPQPQTNQAPVDIANAPEPDLDKLLAATPQLAALFGEEKKSGKTEPTKEPVQNAVEAPPEQEEESQQIELPEALPLEEPEQPAEESKEEEPKPEHDAIQKRIDELTAKRKTAEEKAARLEAEIADLKIKLAAPPRVAPTATSPLANVNSLGELQERHKKAQLAQSWASRHLMEGAEIPNDDGTTQILSAQQVQEIWARAQEMLTQHIPARVSYLNEKAAYDKEAQVFYPNLFKVGSREQLEYNTWLQTVPQLAVSSDAALIMGDYMVGRAIREGKKKSQANGKVQVPSLSKSAPAAAPKVPQERALSRTDLTQIATDPQSGMFDKFVSQLITDHRAKRSKD